MTDFDYECSVRKNLARQAKYRKNGSKSKKCSLPSDRMTTKQWKERCGPVMSYNLGSPMDWETFKAMPASLQAEYISNLQKKYGATASDIARMFDIKPLTVLRHVERNQLNVTFARGKCMNAEQRNVWSNFLSPDIHDGTVEMYNDDAGAASGRNDTSDDTAEVSADLSNAMVMKQVSLRFSGQLDIGAIANSLRMILGKEPSGELEIVCSLA